MTIYPAETVKELLAKEPSNTTPSDYKDSWEVLLDYITANVDTSRSYTYCTADMLKLMKRFNIWIRYPNATEDDKGEPEVYSPAIHLPHGLLHDYIKSVFMTHGLKYNHEALSAMEDVETCHYLMNAL